MISSTAKIKTTDSREKSEKPGGRGNIEVVCVFPAFAITVYDYTVVRTVFDVYFVYRTMHYFI